MAREKWQQAKGNRNPKALFLNEYVFFCVQQISLTRLSKIWSPLALTKASVFSRFLQQPDSFSPSFVPCGHVWHKWENCGLAVLKNVFGVWGPVQRGRSSVWEILKEMQVAHSLHWPVLSRKRMVAPLQPMHGSNTIADIQPALPLLAASIVNENEYEQYSLSWNAPGEATVNHRTLATTAWPAGCPHTIN